MFRIIRLISFFALFLFPGLVSGQDSIHRFSNIFYEYKFALLDKKTPIDLEYNALVRKHIERYINEKPGEISKYLALSKLYFPIFEQYLDKYDLPLELKYLSVVESGLDPTAKSPSGAVGLWQFLYHSGQMFDLEINSYIDERRDVYKSTDAACRYFRYLYQTFNNWQLVLAAYNGGPGVVRNAIERAGGKTGLWDILPYLPEQTQNYVPSFLAMNYLMNDAKAHNIVPSDTAFNFQQLDTLMIDYTVTFKQIASCIGISVELIRFLNPIYKLDMIPETGKKYPLVLPEKFIIEYLRLTNKIIATDTTRLVKAERTQKIYYNVEKGDFLHKIAIKFNCNPQEIKNWNNLNSDFILPGQSLVIWVSN
jgi:membrane-bound lytic murein transglycosylase D